MKFYEALGLEWEDLSDEELEELSKKEPFQVKPVDLERALSCLRLVTREAAVICGITQGQLASWTSKGIVECTKTSKGNYFGYAALEKVCLIKQQLDYGYSLQDSVDEAEAFLAKRAKEKSRLRRLPAEKLSAHIECQVQALRNLSERIRRRQAYRGRRDLGQIAAATRGMEKLVNFFESHPYTVNTAKQIALMLGRDVEVITKELKILEEKNYIQRISYPGNDIYRYLPRRR